MKLYTKYGEPYDPEQDYCGAGPKSTLINDEELQVFSSIGVSAAKAGKRLASKVIEGYLEEELDHMPAIKPNRFNIR